MNAAPHIPLVLKMQDWPEADRLAWNTLFAPGILFEDEGRCIDWSDGTRRMRRQGYGQWLSFLRRTRPEMLALAPCDRITIPNAEAFVAESQLRLRPRSVANLMVSLAVQARAMSPNGDWAKLWRAATRLYRSANSGDLKPKLPLSASDVFRWSLQRMSEVDGDPALPDLSQAIRYRQALLIGVLIACPVRSRAFIGIRVGQHLVEHDGGYDLRFSAADMKDKRAHNYSLASKLIEPMRLYLAYYRPILLQGQDHDGLWISQYGKPLTKDGYTRELPKVTERHLGVPLRPHAFRHIVATSIAEVDPLHVGIIRDILGHATLDMAEKHYNHAAANSSCNKLQSIYGDIRKNALTMDRLEHSRRSAAVDDY